jgi:tight adherence protein B
MVAVALALTSAAGVYLLWTALALGWRGVRVAPAATRRARRPLLRDWIAQAGLSAVSPAEFIAVSSVLGLVGAAIGAAVFNGIVPALILGVFAASVPWAGHRKRRAAQRSVAQEAWPRLIDEIRILTFAAGRSLPQALFEAGRSAPDELRPAFAAAEREWLLSTNFDQTLQVLKDRLGDPTADATCETLLVAHELGGTDVDRRLEALADDRRADVQGRKDARAKQVGARFARSFVLIVPLGMAVAGLSVGDGRAAYGTAQGQVVVAVALGMVVACWVWAGRIMRLPEAERVFP